MNSDDLNGRCAECHYKQRQACADPSTTPQRPTTNDGLGAAPLVPSAVPTAPQNSIQAQPVVHSATLTNNSEGMYAILYYMIVD